MSQTAGDTEVREFEGSFRTGDGTELFERSWELAAGAKAAVIIFHGYGEHSGRYVHLAGRLNREGFDVHTYDQRWHGRSPGKRAYITDFSILPKDGHDFLQHLEAKLGKRPRFLMGHSMGGLILAHYAVRHQPDVAGLVFSSSGVKVADDVAPLVQKTSGILAAVLPWLPVLTIDPATISQIPEEVEKYATDPLNYHGKILARPAHQLLSAVKEIQTRLNEITLPLLALHGGGDQLVEVAASELLYESAASQDKTLKIYEDAYHEVHHDLDAERYLDDLAAWLNQRT